MPNYRTMVPGLNHVGAYQVSGKPYASGSCVAPTSGAASGKPTSQKIAFSGVTRWVRIGVSGSDTTSLRVAFSREGLADPGTFSEGGPVNFGGNYFLARAGDSPVLELKVSELHFMSNGASTVTFDVVAGLTNIQTGSVATLTGSSWSGSLGVG